MEVNQSFIYLFWINHALIIHFILLLLFTNYYFYDGFSGYETRVK